MVATGDSCIVSFATLQQNRGNLRLSHSFLNLQTCDLASKKNLTGTSVQMQSIKTPNIDPDSSRVI